jgi:hypothetical protein
MELLRLTPRKSRLIALVFKTFLATSRYWTVIQKYENEDGISQTHLYPLNWGTNKPDKLKYKFTIDDFPNTTFELGSSVWNGRSYLYMDGKLLKQSTEKGLPFLIPTKNGITKGYPKSSFPDFAPSIVINDQKHLVASKLEWYQFTLATLPVLLVFLGGAMGGVLGIAATIFNFQAFRSESNRNTQYAKVIVTNIAAYLIFLVIANVVMKQLNG